MSDIPIIFMQNENFYCQRTKICVGYLKGSLCAITVTVLRVHTTKWAESALKHQNASIRPIYICAGCYEAQRIEQIQLCRHFVYHSS